MLPLLRFSSLFLTILAFAPSAAHLLELPHKLQLRATEYMTVQQIYRGWSLSGVAIISALLSLGVYLRAVWHAPGVRRFVGLALAALLAAQVIFWTLTFPVNQRTNNWTTLPVDWISLRARWEWSHAAGAFLDLVAIAALLIPLSRTSQLPEHREDRGRGERI